jgi:hypothetical protein
MFYNILNIRSLEETRFYHKKKNWSTSSTCTNIPVARKIATSPATQCKESQFPTIFQVGLVAENDTHNQE